MVPVTIGVGYVGWMGIVIAAGVGVGVGGERVLMGGHETRDR